MKREYTIPSRYKKKGLTIENSGIDSEDYKIVTLKVAATLGLTTILKNRTGGLAICNGYKYILAVLPGNTILRIDKSNLSAKLINPIKKG